MKHLQRALQSVTLQGDENRTTKPSPPSGSRWSGIIGTGQSLAMGGDAPLNQTTRPVPGALKLYDVNEQWDMDKPNASSLRLLPLTEPFHKVNPIVGWYPWNIAGKTPQSAMAAQIFEMVATKEHRKITTVHSCVAKSGEVMKGICKGGTQNAYQASMYEAKALTRLARKSGNSLGYDAIVLTHGETDAGEVNREYLDQLIAMQRDYARDLKEITGQDSSPVLILSQQNSNPMTGNEISVVTQAQWRAQAESSNAVICAGPKYQYGYSPGCLHMPAASYDRLGEKYGQAFFETMVEKRPFVPLSPKSLSMQKPRLIKIEFHVPYPPLQWDEHLNKPHVNNHQNWAKGRGFEVWGGKGGELVITNVKIDETGHSVTISLAKPPAAFPVTVAYAMTADQPGFSGGCAGGRVGHLCDSDLLLGASAEQVRVEARDGSHELRSNGLFKDRALYDVVDPGGYVVTGIDPQKPDVVVLDRPWQGRSGSQELFFRHNHRNYLVAFVARVGDNPFSDLGL